jgi:hypothetical protein
MKTIRVTTGGGGEWQEVILINRIIKITKDMNEKFTGCWIHLDTGDKVYVEESMNVIEACIQLAK